MENQTFVSVEENEASGLINKKDIWGISDYNPMEERL